jgi:glyoxylase-like metal-dependent hydrolase (beta-lactamase superfamily II)
VRVKDARVVFCGDLLWKDHVPNLIDASTEQWIATLQVLRNDYPRSVFVPGHGGIADSEDVTTFRDYLVGLRTRVQDGQGRGQSDDSLVSAILPSLKNKYGAWGFFDDFAKENIRQTAQEVAGRKRVPQSLKPGGAQ